LLELKARNDKSKFLAKAGFTQANADMLRDAIRFLAASSEAVDDGSNEYGTFYRVEGDLPGANRFRLSVVTIWLKRHIDGVFQFVTLKPKGESR
jgi:hypothetical protein